MGYTHYWRINRRLTDQEWFAFADGVERLVTRVNRSGKTKLTYEYHDNRKPQIDDNVVRFNGFGDHGYETFLVSRNGVGFAFCKTQWRSYDLAVTACLAALAAIAPDAVEVRSDGDYDAWIKGVVLAIQVWRRDIPNPIAETVAA